MERLTRSLFRIGAHKMSDSFSRDGFAFNSFFGGAQSGSSSDFFEQAAKKPGTLIISDSVLRQSNFQTEIARLTAAGWRMVSHSGEPSMSSISESLRSLEGANLSRIVAIGGGSVIDAAKILRAFSSAPELFSATNLNRKLELRNDSTPDFFLAIPTTIGSGSEVSSSALIRNDNDKKTAIFGKSLIPSEVIFDPALVATNSDAQLARSLSDAFSHSIESYLSLLKNPVAENFAVDAARGIINNVQSVIARDEEAIARAQIYASVSGRCQDVMLVGPMHGIAHGLSMPHGLGIAITMPFVVNWYCRVGGEVSDKLNDFLSLVGISLDELEDFFKVLVGYSDLASFDFASIGDLNNLQNDASEDPSARLSPVPLSVEMIDSFKEYLISLSGMDKSHV